MPGIWDEYKWISAEAQLRLIKQSPWYNVSRTTTINHYPYGDLFLRGLCVFVGPCVGNPDHQGPFKIR